MPEHNAESERGSAQTPDQSKVPVESSYEELLKDRLKYLAREVSAQKELDRLWRKKRAEMEKSKDLPPNAMSFSLKEIESERERNKELEARAEKNFTRVSHTLESLESIERENKNEGRKLMYDWFKHLTTLGTGSILILGALSNNLLYYATHKGLIPFIFFLIFASVVGALTYMYLVSDLFLTSDMTQESQESRGGKANWLIDHLGYVFLATLSLFAIGIALFIIFATINLFS